MEYLEIIRMSFDADLTDSCVVRTFVSRIQTPSIELASKESFMENSVFIGLWSTKEISRKMDPELPLVKLTTRWDFGYDTFYFDQKKGANTQASKQADLFY